MRRGIRWATIWAGLAVLGAMVAGGREARAAIGIKITGSGGTVTGSDPPYFYSLDLTINPTFFMNPKIDSITVYGFTDLTSSSLLSPPLGSPPAGQPSPFFISAYDLTNPSDESVTWSVTSSVPAGDYQPFIVYTESLSSPPEPVTLTYSAELNGGTFSQPSSGSDSGPPVTITFTPEPSAWVYLVSAATVAPLVILRTRWRRRSSSAAGSSSEGRLTGPR